MISQFFFSSALQCPERTHDSPIMDRSRTAVCSFHFIYFFFCNSAGQWLYTGQGVKQAKLFLCASQDATAQGFRPPTHVMNNELVVLVLLDTFATVLSCLPPILNGISYTHYYILSVPLNALLAAAAAAAAQCVCNIIDEGFTNLPGQIKKKGKPLQCGTA